MSLVLVGMASGCAFPLAPPFTFHETAEVAARGKLRITAMGGGGTNHESVRVPDDPALPWAAGVGARLRVGIGDGHEIGGDLHALWIYEGQAVSGRRPDLLGWKLAWKWAPLSTLGLVAGLGGNIPVQKDSSASLGPDLAAILSARAGGVVPYAGLRVGANWGIGGSATPTLGLVGALGLSIDLVGPLALFIEGGVPVSWMSFDSGWETNWGWYGSLALSLRL